MTEAYFAKLLCGRDGSDALAAEGEQSACHLRGRARCVAGEAMPGLLAPAGDADQDDGGEWHSHRDHRDRQAGGYPDLMHVSSVR
jgi:hypothetical protein